MFDKAFVRPGSARGLSLPAAIALHGLALGAIVGSSVWFVAEPSEPRIPVTFPKISGNRPAGTPAGPERSGGSGRSGRRLPARARLDVLRSTLPVPSDREVLPEQDFEDTAGPVPDGGGLPGDGFAVGPSGDGDSSADRSGEIVRPGGDVAPPGLLTRVEPEYPEAARKARMEGVVILDAVIAASGEVEEVRVIRSAGRLLDNAAAQALRRWTYRPATLNGRAVRVLLTVTVAFRLH